MAPVYVALICLGCVGLVALAAVFAYCSNNLIGVSRYEIKSKKAPGNDVRIVHISDLHGKRFGRGNRRLISRVARLTPDFIAVTGDLIHKYRPRDVAVAEEAVRGLSQIAPVYFVSGNHEMRSTKYRELASRLKDAGAAVLENTSVSAFGINICGVNCADIKRGRYFSLPKEGEYNLLLAHYPQYIDRYAAAGYDLALSGHAHGGQWRIPFTPVGIYAPGQGLFPKYTAKTHSCGDMRGVISRGLGNSQFPLRLFNRPEIVVVTVKKELN